MRLLTLLLFTLLCTCGRGTCIAQAVIPTNDSGSRGRAQKMRVDTVEGPFLGYTALRYITEMPAGSEMSKADRFMRGLSGDAEVKGWDRLDSLVVFDQDGERVETEKVVRIRKEIREDIPFFDDRVVHLDGRIGAPVSSVLRVNNPRENSLELKRTDDDINLRTNRNTLSVPSHGSAELTVKSVLPAGSATHVVRMADGEKTILELRVVLNGYDLNEEDFMTNRETAPVWQVPSGRETLYLRLQSTEKLMTIYKDGRIYSKVAVGRQLDELNLSGLGVGEYQLEVIDLGTGQRRYHGLRRAR